MSLAESVASRLRRPDFDEWLGGAARAGFCSNPVRLSGSTSTVLGDTGEVLSAFASDGQPDQVAYTRCGNRRAKRCESCSHEYKGDTWHMIMAGAAGGMKGVPDDVATHPMVFLTLTAPSFGAVHSVAGGRRRGTCVHGQPFVCTCGHEGDDPQLGEPMCTDCYDYTSHVVWQFHAPELWRRFTIQLRRRLATQLGLTHKQAAGVVRVQFAKVAEFQRRGAVHFHAIVRVDGVDEVEEFPTPPSFVTTRDLVAAIRWAARAVSYLAPPLPGETNGAELRWGTQLDVQPIVHHDGLDGALSDHAVAAYIAKYATKATEEVESADRPRLHVQRIRDMATAIAASDLEGPYALLGRWSHMLGFRGHFSSKSRRYSVTLGSLRGARRRWRIERSLDRADSERSVDEVLVVGDWRFAGMGWRTAADKMLAQEAGRALREWRAERRPRFKGESDA